MATGCYQAIALATGRSQLEPYQDQVMQLEEAIDRGASTLCAE